MSLMELEENFGSLKSEVAQLRLNIKALQMALGDGAIHVRTLMTGVAELHEELVLANRRLRIIYAGFPGIVSPELLQHLDKSDALAKKWRD